MADSQDIKVKFHQSQLSNQEDQVAETVGMLILATDFYGDKSIKKYEKVTRISKTSIPIFLSQTRSGGYLAINPSSNREIRIPTTNLVSNQELRTFVDNQKNLELNQIYKKIMNLKVDYEVLKGGVSREELTILNALLAAPRVSGNWEFTPLPSRRPLNEIKADIKAINTTILDQATLGKEIDSRLAIIEEAFQKNVSDQESTLKEKMAFWTQELKTIKATEASKIKSRQSDLEKSISVLEKDLDKKKQSNLATFQKIVGRNIVKDGKEIVKLLGAFEALEKDTKNDPILQAQKLIEELKDATDVFFNDLHTARRNVTSTQNTSADLDADFLMEKQDLEKKAQQDIEAIKMEYEQGLTRSQTELADLESKVTASKTKLDEYSDKKLKWKKELEKKISMEGAPTLASEELKTRSPGDFLTLYIPFYLFQYVNNNGNDLATITIPPVVLPTNLKKLDKSGIFGKHKSISYLPVSPKATSFFDWLPDALENDLVIKNAVEGLTNLVEQTIQMRDIFLQPNTKELFVKKLNMSEKAYGAASGRLTNSVFT